MRVNEALQFLKRFSKAEIVVAKARANEPVKHDQVIDCHVPPQLSDHAAAIHLKTGLHQIVPTLETEWCYLDSDVIAVSDEVDDIFNRRGSIGFTQDHVTIDVLSPYLTNCGCKENHCTHFRDAARRTFAVDMPNGSWIPWNGGVFVFGRDSVELLDLWHAYSSEILSHPDWRIRDQGALAAAAWKLGLQHRRTLPRRFNKIVDGMRLIHRDRRTGITPSQLAVDTSYSLASKTRRPAFLHFIQGTIGMEGWKNWDDARRLLAAPAQKTNISAPQLLGGSGASVNCMWIGDTLSKLELLTLRSFVRHGHRVHLWLYDEIKVPMPSGVILEDASEIIPRRFVFKKKTSDPECGVGEASYGAPFSDLFRYKLLHDKGGYWVDLDVTCLRPFPDSPEYLFRTHRIGVVGNIMRCPKGSRLMGLTFDETLKYADENAEWLLPNRLLTKNIRNLGLDSFIKSDFCNDDSWHDFVLPMIEGNPVLPNSWHAIHWINEMWRTLERQDGIYKNRLIMRYKLDKNEPKQGTTLAHLYAEYDLSPSRPVDRTRAGFPDASGPRATSVTPRVSARSTDVCDFNVLIWSLALGGAERILVDTICRLGSNVRINCFIMESVEPSFNLIGSNVHIYSLAGDCEARCKTIVSQINLSTTKNIFAHLCDHDVIKRLTAHGLEVIPVVHNSTEGWTIAPHQFNRVGIPFVVAVCDAVAQDLRKHGCNRRVVTVRHQVTPPDLNNYLAYREEVRSRCNIKDDTLLIGMVGQFKSQKDYPKAVRVLASLKEIKPAKLMIVGSSNYAWGDMSATVTDTRAVATRLGVSDDLIFAEPTEFVNCYYAAFDVFLNTSKYEGFCISILEALSWGLPVVASDVGGIREIKAGEQLVITSQDAVPAEFARCISLFGQRDRFGPQTRRDNVASDLWSLLSRFGSASSYEDRRKTGCVIDLSRKTGSDLVKQAIQALSARHFDYIFSLTTISESSRLMLLGISKEIHQVDWRSVPAEVVPWILREVKETGVSQLYICNIDYNVRLALAKILPPEAVKIFDFDDKDVLFDGLQSVVQQHEEICYDASEYFRRLSPLEAENHAVHPTE